MVSPLPTSPANRTYRIGEWTLDVACHRLRRGEQERVLEPKELTVLVLLADAAPALVATEELLAAAWPHSMVVSNAVHQVISRLRSALDDDARAPTYIETLPKCGYRLIARVEPPDGPSARDAALQLEDRARSKAAWRGVALMLAAGVAALVVISSSGWFGSADSTRSPVGPLGSTVVAVPPFSSPDSHERAGTAFRDELLRRLSRIASLTVLPALDPHAEPPPRVLSGSVRPIADDRLQVSVHLAARPGGRLLWFESFDMPAVGSSPEKVEAVERVARATKMFLDPLRHRLFGITRDRDEVAVSAFLLGMLELHQADAESFAAAISHFDQSLRLDPEFAAPWYGKAVAYRNYSNYGKLSRRDAWQQIRILTQRGLAADDTLPLGMALKADLALYDGRFEEAHRLIRRLEAAHPGPLVAFHHAICGRLEKALQVAERAVESDPELTWAAYSRVMVLWLAGRHGEALAAMGRYEEAVRWLQRGYQMDPIEFLWFRQMPLPGLPEMRRHPAFVDLMARTVGSPETCPAADLEGRLD